MKKLFIILLATPFLFSCGREKEKLKAKVDSLQSELIVRDEMQKTLDQVGVLMDSIDANRKAVRLDLSEGTTYGNYAQRMNSINKYVLESQAKLEELESKSKQNRVFAQTVKNLKAELKTKNEEIVRLKNQVAELGTQNESMRITIDTLGEELKDKQAQIDTKLKELELIEAKIQELMAQSKMSEADGYFARGQAAEEIARRTQLAPKKKKQSLKEALEFYQKALELGNDKAQAKIDELNKKLK